MKYLKLDTYSGGLNISKIAFGTGSAMRELPKKEFFRLFDIYAEAGGNCLDTAPGYNGGRSEAYIGEWMKTYRNRQDIVISTKACHSFEGQASRLSKKDMEDDINQSLRAMQIEHIDLIWIHKDDLNWPVETIIENINAIINTGKVGAVGCSNWSTKRIEQANQFAKENGMYGFLTSQIQWSLARIEGDAYKNRYNALVMNDPMYDWYLKNNMPIFAFSALSQGFFAKATASGIESLSEEKRAFYETPDNIKRLEKVKAYMQTHNVPSSTPVLGYLINNRLPCVALISSTSPDRLIEALTAADTDFSVFEADNLFKV